MSFWSYSELGKFDLISLNGDGLSPSTCMAAFNKSDMAIEGIAQLDRATVTTRDY